MGQPTRDAYFPAGFNTSYIIGRREARLFYFIIGRREARLFYFHEKAFGVKSDRLGDLKVTLVACFHPHSWWALPAPVPHGVRPRGAAILSPAFVLLWSLAQQIVAVTRTGDP
jgi:hypothetical protein